ncbi:MAG: signal peptidase I [Planctomycetota bacterium]
MSAKKDKKKEKKHFRENIEAITMAIAVALLFKTFVLEVSKIPSGSMQPTLMGSLTAGVNDRVLVDKLSFRFRDPKRWEIVVFKHPLERSRVMVKRLIGMPEEDLKIEYGDLWHRVAGGEWTVLRRPDTVMATVWKSLDVDEPSKSSWEAVSGEGWRTSGRSIQARGDGRARFRPGQGSIVDRYADGYPDALRGEIEAEARGRLGARGQFDRHPINYVGDLRLEGRVEPDAGAELVYFKLQEGLRTYEFMLPGPAAAAGSKVEVQVRDSEVYTGSGRRPDRVETGPELRLEAGDETRFLIQNLDDRLLLEVDGETLVELDIEPSPDQSSSVSVGLRGGTAEFTDLDLQRDIFYVLQDLQGTVTIPAGHYFFLGDNTLDSADGRDWKAIEYTWNDGDGPRTGRGNHRPGENPRVGEDEDGVLYKGFRDQWGNVDWFPSDAATAGTPVPAPLVPRELIQGRALVVFWPIYPHKGIWRLGWLR